MSKTFQQMLDEVQPEKMEDIKKCHIIFAEKLWTKTDFEQFCKENNLSFVVANKEIANFSI